MRPESSGRAGGGSRGLGLLAGAALELELVGEARGAAVELGDAVEQAALRARSRRRGCGAGELGLVGLAGRALGVEVRTQGGEHGAVGLARRLHLRAQLGGEVLAGRLAAGSTSARSDSSCSRTSASAARSAARSSRRAASADWSACRAARSRASSSWRAGAASSRE